MFIEKMEEATNIAYTENGAVTYQTSLSDLVDFLASGGATRDWNDFEINRMVRKAFVENPIIATKLLFYFRDVQFGQGERRMFRTAMTMLAHEYPVIAVGAIRFIPKYGRFDDLYAFVGTPVENEMWSFVSWQLLQDAKSYAKGEPVSLLAKWLKSEKTHNKTNPLGVATRKALKMSSRSYRLVLSKLRKAINIVEAQMSANEWEEIDFEKVPSQAMYRYGSAFRLHAGNKFNEYLKKVSTGDATIKAGTLYPHQLVGKYLDGTPLDSVIEAQWKALPDYLPEDGCEALVVADTSGSMYASGINSPINVSIGLAIYMSERMKNSHYQNKFITFSDQPKLQNIKGNTLYDKVDFLVESEWGYSTNLKAVYQLILDIAIKNKLTQKQLPPRVIVISDMQFNEGAVKAEWLYDLETGKTALKAEITNMFEAAGYKMPLTVWWNVSAREGQIPMTIKEEGLMVSGFSPQILTAVLNNKIISPIDVLMDIVERKRYVPLDGIFE